MLEKKEVANLVAGLTAPDATKCNEIIERLKLISNTYSDTSLAKVLGLKQASVSNAKTRGLIPPAWIINASKIFNVSADWLINGGSEMKNIEQKQQYTPQKAKHTANLVSPPFDFDRFWSLFYNENEARRGWLQIEIMKRFPEFSEWLEARTEKNEQMFPAESLASLEADESFSEDDI